ncbi:HEPN domain-containing protein [Anaerosporobacter sp.]|uniref:HEPN domain-containing protein n=1 Tax=Anaerosporobacter sp. TaxID=1872529 RepID=UPI00286EFD34|nr:HEPN domain-containing protein [Anaerosporobacter sp.]
MTERNLSLSKRNENIRDKNPVRVIRFQLSEIKQHYEENIEAIREQFLVAEELVSKGKLREAENVWRSQVVFLESTFDFFLHEITKYGLCEIFLGNWDKTEKYQNIEIQMRFIEIALKARENTDWFLEFVNNCYEKITMVSFESVKDQMNLLGIDIRAVADRAFHERGQEEKTKDKLKRRLNELFRRRNIIAHQSDREHFDAQLKEISEDVVRRFLDDVGKIVEAIYYETENM